MFIFEQNGKRYRAHVATKSERQFFQAKSLVAAVYLEFYQAIIDSNPDVFVVCAYLDTDMAQAARQLSRFSRRSNHRNGIREPKLVCFLPFPDISCATEHHLQKIGPVRQQHILPFLQLRETSYRLGRQHGDSRYSIRGTSRRL